MTDSAMTPYGSPMTQRGPFPFESPGEHLSEAQRIVRQVWANALRSGKYRQGHNVLKDPAGGHCCLGVLCDILDPQGWVVRPASVLDGGYDPHTLSATSLLPETITHRGDRSYPGPDVARTAGLTEMQMQYLASGNDLRGWDFHKIADVVEQGIPVEPMLPLDSEPSQLSLYP
jgi:hypothetical protein